jgi:hypothetical protein
LPRKPAPLASSLGNWIGRLIGGERFMMIVNSPARPQNPVEMDLQSLIHLRTGRQISGLHVEMSPGRVVLRGRARSFYVKLMAQHCVLESLPNTCLTNAIIVEAGRVGNA